MALEPLPSLHLNCGTICLPIYIFVIIWILLNLNLKHIYSRKPLIPRTVIILITAIDSHMCKCMYRYICVCTLPSKVYIFRYCEVPRAQLDRCYINVVHYYYLLLLFNRISFSMCTMLPGAQSPILASMTELCQF